jgi:hypothetical protein
VTYFSGVIPCLAGSVRLYSFALFGLGRSLVMSSSSLPIDSDSVSDSSFFSPVLTIFVFLVVLFGGIGFYAYYARQELAKAGMLQQPKKVLSKKKAAKLAKQNRFSIGDS